MQYCWIFCLERHGRALSHRCAALLRWHAATRSATHLPGYPKSPPDPNTILCTFVNGLDCAPPAWFLLASRSPQMRRDHGGGLPDVLHALPATPLTTPPREDEDFFAQDRPPMVSSLPPSLPLQRWRERVFFPHPLGNIYLNSRLFGQVLLLLLIRPIYGTETEPISSILVVRDLFRVGREEALSKRQGQRGKTYFAWVLCEI